MPTRKFLAFRSSEIDSDLFNSYTLLLSWGGAILFMRSCSDAIWEVKISSE